jgi:hypothetical protein
MRWSGKTDVNHNGALADDPVKAICLGRYHSLAGPRALVIDASTGWCAACRQQTKTTLIPLVQSGVGQVSVVQVLIEGWVVGQAAVIKDVDAWATENAIPFDVVIDEPRQILRLLSSDNDSGRIDFPQSIVVRTDTMRITYTSSGLDPAGLTSAIEAILRSDGGNDQ